MKLEATLFMLNIVYLFCCYRPSIWFIKQAQQYILCVSLVKCFYNCRYRDYTCIVCFIEHFMIIIMLSINIDGGGRFLI